MKNIGTVLFFLVAFSAHAQKNIPLQRPGTNPILNGAATPKQNPARPVIRPTQPPATQRVPTDEFKKNGSSFFVTLQNLSVYEALQTVRKSFSLGPDHSFIATRQVTDNMGMTHYTFCQYYKGIKAEEAMVLLHSKNGLVASANGQVSAFEHLSITPSISKEKAKQHALNFMKAKTYIKTDYEIELLITKDRATDKHVLAYKVRLDAAEPLDMANIFIDAQTGKVLNKIPLIAHADVPGTAQTLYSGTQSITADSYNGGFRLRDNARNIQTYNATSAGWTDNIGYTGYSDFTDTDNLWTGAPILSLIGIQTLSNSWWYAPIIDPNADIYIVIRNGSNQIVYTSNPINNTNAPIAVQSNLELTNPPYTVELWDYDLGSSDDYGGSFTINSTDGYHSFSASGNSGGYVISNKSAAFDAHWGMEKSFDFYLSVFGRNSYDGNGSVIKNFIYPIGLINNAQALPAPYNFMRYGIGVVQDGPVVGLDVAGHEFTHMVTANNGLGGLYYQNESGALNESFSDIFGSCIELYSGVNPDWTVGEGVVQVAPYYMRSMSNPNATGQPDTYHGDNWHALIPSSYPNIPADSDQDFGGVHTNSGVQNFWFYLLCQGGSGTNDAPLNNNYSVTGIGISQARLIAYNNLMYHLSPNATYWDAYVGSLDAAAQLYGIGSTQWNAVNNAWYAVGIGNGTNNNTAYCTGTTYMYEPSGSLSDGSGNTNYLDYSDCIWSIQPAGANTVTITFPQFSTEAGYDSVMVYDGPDENYPLLMTWWGNTLPPAITSTEGALTVRFMSDELIQAPGWTANYTSSGIAYCDGGNLLTTPTGSFNDGSSANNYGNNQYCYWYIAPPCANSVTLSFSQFNTELGYDGIIVYNGSDLNAPVLLNTSGTALPGSVTANSGEMLVLFISDFSTRMQGFTANYTSSGSAYCTGVINPTTDWGQLTDGSGTNDYCNNMQCNWLIQPTGATSITLNFIDFNLEQASSDGLSIYDAVEVYDGPNTSSTLLGRFTGSQLPNSLTSSGTSMYVKFYSDEAVTAPGWSAYYTSTTANFCSGLTTLTAPSGTFVDGSGTGVYGNNADCQWLIQPPGVSNITLGFTAFDTELDYDGVVVYDGATTNSPILNQFTGTNLPGTTTSTGGAMLVQFLSDIAVRQNGWNAYYNSNISVGLTEVNSTAVRVFPNPNNGVFTVQLVGMNTEKLNFQLFDAIGHQVEGASFEASGSDRFEVRIDKANGLYVLEIRDGESVLRQRVVVK